MKKSAILLSSGFTLIELMVAVAIISMLFGVVLSSTGILRSTSANTKRKADLAEIQSALQNYYADQNYFPHSAAGGFRLNGSGASTTLTSVIGASPVVPNPVPPLKTYLKTVPTDPTTSYCYVAVTNSANPQPCTNAANSRCNYYYLSAALDNPQTAMTVPAAGQCSGLSTNYLVTP